MCLLGQRDGVRLAGSEANPREHRQRTGAQEVVIELLRQVQRRACVALLRPHVLRIGDRCKPLVGGRP